MQELTEQGKQKVSDLAQRHGVSTEAVMALLEALIRGNGTLAQFSHPDLGGSGQWMRGGMVMVGDMFNSGLKAKVDALCNELAQLLAQQPMTVPAPASQWQGGQQQQQGGYAVHGQSGQAPQPSLFVPAAPASSGNWWPDGLGSPSATGSQNDLRYACFAQSRRLAVQVHGKVTVYDTLDHAIGGVSQQQGGGASFTFTSQHGTVPIASLPIISTDGSAPPSPAAAMAPKTPPESPLTAEAPQDQDIFAKIEKLADLEKKGILTKEEYAAKKAELLGRL